MQRVAQDWLVLVLTAGSGTALGITTGLQFLPILLLSPLAGLVADRVPKRRLLQATNLAMTVPALLLGLLAVTGTAQVWHVYVLAFALGVGCALGPDSPKRAVAMFQNSGRRAVYPKPPVGAPTTAGG
jgi:MFS family permease